MRINLTLPKNNTRLLNEWKQDLGGTQVLIK